MKPLAATIVSPMVTYLYWLTIILLALLALGFIGAKLEAWKAAITVAVLLLLTGWGAYVFHFQQIFVKRYGGVMTIRVPEGERHIHATWKDDNLWVENYDPETNTCHFTEYSKGNVLQGKVTIKDCNPLLAP